MKMKCCWALLSALVILTAMATMADGCSCAKRHPQEHYCSADFGTYFSQIIIMAECCTLATFSTVFFSFFLNLTFTCVCSGFGSREEDRARPIWMVPRLQGAHQERVQGDWIRSSGLVLRTHIDAFTRRFVRYPSQTGTSLPVDGKHPLR